MDALLPPGADEAPAICMGDARLVNGLIAGDEVRALVDFEIAYAGNPAADIGYSLFMDRLARSGTRHPLPGLPSADETWERWGEATGRPTGHRGYWTAFGAMILAVTATRAMVQWGLAGPSTDEENPMVGAWAALVEEAGPR
jgi:aminoglycoside phosphotransferase (APT) family kinase protein